MSDFTPGDPCWVCITNWAPATIVGLPTKERSTYVVNLAQGSRGPCDLKLFLAWPDQLRTPETHARMVLTA